MRALKPSRYNHIFSYSDGLALAYNSLTGSVVKLAGQEGEEIRISIQGGSQRPHARLRKGLKDAGFLVEADINELNVVRQLFHLGRRQKGVAQLTILPTLACNLACSYCFESHSNGVMAENVAEALLEFTDRVLLPGSPGLSVEWFGGEPLLGIDLIERLSAAFRERCAKRAVEYYPAGVITNGCLLTPAMAKRLLAAGVHSAQVTLDGPLEVHDRRRPAAGGAGTFQRIIENLKMLPDELDVAIRVNVDSSNSDHTLRLLDFLARDGISHRARPYVARVEEFSEQCNFDHGNTSTSAEFAAFNLTLRQRCLETDIPWSSDDPPRLVAPSYCIVDTRKGFVVMPDGALLKCWAEAGNEMAHPVAHLLDRHTWRHPTPSPLQSRDPFDDAECCECTVLPLCMGGCPRLRANFRNAGFKRCPSIRFSLTSEVRAMFERYERETSQAEQSRCS